MCEYCGCQAVATIAELTREHDAALDVMRAARRAIAADELEAAGGLCRELLRLLAPHNAVEEQSLFVAMREEYPEHVDVLLAEHVLVHAVLEELGNGTSTDEWQQRLTDALHILREHIAKEQDGVFPAAVLTLTTAQWEAAEQVRATVGSALTSSATARAAATGELLTGCGELAVAPRGAQDLGQPDVGALLP